MITTVVASVLLLQSPAAQAPPPPDCAQLLAMEPPARGVAALCAAEDAMRQAAAAPAGSAERVAQWRAAAEGYQRSTDVLQSTAHRIHALEMLVHIYDGTRLNDPAAVERALRALATIDVATAAPLVRLARFQESQKRFESAEQTFYGARQQYPDGIELLREMSRFFARRVLALAPPEPKPTAGGSPQPAPAAQEKYAPDCMQTTFSAPTRGLADLCRAAEEVRLAAKALQAPPGKKLNLEEARRVRTAHLTAAAGLYRKAAAGLGDDEQRIHAYEALADIYDSKHLNDPAEAEPVVRELIALTPGSAEPVIRLSTVQEALKQIDSAEATLIGARQLFPDDLDVLRALSRFYARLASAAAMTLSRAERAAEVPPAPGQPDKDGYYSIGAHVPAPKKVQNVTAAFPAEAKAVVLQGIVILELRLDATGRVVDVRPVRPIPMLDDAAIAAAKQWRFTPTIVDGRAVPVKMTTTHNFTIKK